MSLMGTVLGVLANLTAPTTGVGSFTCQPGHSCWPSLQEWDAFNQTVSGRLKVPVILSSPCFPSSPNFNEEECASVLGSYGDGFFRQSIHGALQNTAWEGCGNENCFPGIVPPRGPTCSLGRLSPVYVDVETPDDIAATFAFSKKHDIRIVIKNTGHDYFGRSASANSLAMRTNNLKNMAFEPEFTAHNCPAANKKNIGIIGAGVNAAQAIGFFSKHGMSVTTGACPTVGIAGGFGLGGGHGPLTPTHGLMVDQAVEFDVVTTDGVFRTINECNEPDLFWAMRGGGGSSFAVLVNYKFQLHPEVKWATWRIEATLSPDSPDVTENTVLREILTSASNEQYEWSKNRVTGYDTVSHTFVSFFQILPDSGDALAKLKKATANFHSFMTTHPGIKVTTDLYQVFDNQPEFYAGEAEGIAAGSIVGASILTPSRLITTDDVETPEKIDTLVSAFLQGMETVRQQLGEGLAAGVGFFLLKTGAINTPDTEQATSVNPAWRKTLWHVIVIAAWPPGAPKEVSDKIAATARNALDELKAPLSVQAAYFNEADPAEPDWKNVFFGEPYEKLLAIKKKWDPDTVLNCAKCVGYLGEQGPMYSCDSKNPIPSVPYPFGLAESAIMDDGNFIIDMQKEL
ncbi:hypothetical protein V8C43DRAFT_315958 [Trichoderma afarasin]